MVTKKQIKPGARFQVDKMFVWVIDEVSESRFTPGLILVRTSMEGGEKGDTGIL